MKYAKNIDEYTHKFVNKLIVTNSPHTTKPTSYLRKFKYSQMYSYMRKATIIVKIAPCNNT